MRIVGGQHKRRPLKAPKGLPRGQDVRPTADRVREALFNILEHGLEGLNIREATVLDVFAGTGALGLEALSRGAQHACFIDSNKQTLDCARENAGNIGEGRRVTLLKLDATKLPPPPLAAQAPAALAFLDPPYRSELAGAALKSLKSKGWIAPGSVCVVELAAREAFDLPEGFEELDRRTYGAAQVLFLRLTATS